MEIYLFDILIGLVCTWRSEEIDVKCTRYIYLYNVIAMI